MPRKRFRHNDYKRGPKHYYGDYTLPGYNYLGPGNRLDKGPPTSRNDAVALKHDIGYQDLIDQGKDPYYNWNDADETALAEFDFSDFGGAAGKSYFRLKKLAHQAGLIANADAPSTPKNRKRLRGDLDTHIEPHEKPVAKRRDIRDGESSSVANLPPTNNMSGNGSGDGSGSGNDAGLKETPIDDVFFVHRGIPDYTFASLPFMETRGHFLTNTWNQDHVYRMTSPYDPAVSLAVLDINTGAGLTLSGRGITAEPDANVIKANWFDYYASIYNYYHVLSCRYNIYVENKGGKDIMCHVMFYNDDIPPTEATNEDMMSWSGVRSQYLKSPYNSILSTGRIETNGFNYDATADTRSAENDGSVSTQTNFETGENITSRSGHVSCNFSGVYSPGDFRREIRLDSQVENWTAVTANPLLPERLLLRIKPETPALGNDANNYGDALAYKLVVKLEYLVEFKEVKPGLRWPVQRNPATVVISQDFLTATN